MAEFVAIDRLPAVDRVISEALTRFIKPLLDRVILPDRASNQVCADKAKFSVLVESVLAADNIISPVLASINVNADKAILAPDTTEAVVAPCRRILSDQML